jgi:hypothetical protein
MLKTFPEDGLRSETYVGAYNNIEATLKVVPLCIS